ncbi:hypothetical protein [Paraburkholderia sp. Tr-20389]|nr:hypothetical protein [Paraburkholderia sp. Tr-20389]
MKRKAPRLGVGLIGQRTVDAGYNDDLWSLLAGDVAARCITRS